MSDVRPMLGHRIRPSDTIVTKRWRSRARIAGSPLAVRGRVVSPDHEFLVELFRRRPELARELLRLCARQIVPGDRSELGSVDLTQVLPAEFRADATVVTRDETGKAVAAIVVEVQLRIDERKRFTWPVYVSVLRANLECEVTLLVIAPELSVATWCARPIRIGGGMSLLPQVVGFEDVPHVITSSSARAQPELAILAALAHEDVAAVQVALEELRRLPEDDQDVYFDLLDRLLPEPLRRLHMDFKHYRFQGETFLKAIAEGREEGREEGRRQVLRDLIARRFGIAIDDADPRIAKLDPSRYQQLLDRIMSAPTLEALFQGL